MLGFLTSSKSKERMRENLILILNLHYLVFISMFEFDPHPSLPPPPPTLLFFLYNFPKSNLGVKDIICPIGD